MTESKLNKRLYTDITRLKLLDKDTADVRFRLQKSPFTGDEDEDELADQKREEYVIIGQIFPKSNIFNERSYSIEIKLTKTFPFEPPEVRFLTPIYHPNIDKDGRS
jgi:ubiquitin-protein ligase